MSHNDYKEDLYITNFKGAMQINACPDQVWEENTHTHTRQTKN